MSQNIIEMYERTYKSSDKCYYFINKYNRRVSTTAEINSWRNIRLSNVNFFRGTEHFSPMPNDKKIAEFPESGSFIQELVPELFI